MRTKAQRLERAVCAQNPIPCKTTALCLMQCVMTVRLRLLGCCEPKTGTIYPLTPFGGSNYV